MQVPFIMNQATPLETTPLETQLVNANKIMSVNLYNTLPNTVNNLAGATSFATFILSPGGGNILENQGLHIIKPEIEGNV